MKIFGLHWATHLLYFAALSGLFFLGKNRLGQAAFLKKEMGKTQERALSDISFLRQAAINDIQKYADAFPSEDNKKHLQDATRALAWVNAFGKNRLRIAERFRHGESPAGVNWHTALLDDYHSLSDSLSVMYGRDSLHRAWLNRCLDADDRDFPPEQVASMLSTSDTADAARICLNLHLKAELALKILLSSVADELKSQEVSFDGVIPGFSYTQCPRAGVPFRAEIFLACFSQWSENITARVNGAAIPIKNGLAHYTAAFKRPGRHLFNINIQIRNPLTGEIKTYIKEFETNIMPRGEF